MIFGRGADQKSLLFPLKAWLFCNLFYTIVGFFTVFGNFSECYKGFCFYAVLVFFVMQQEKNPQMASRPVPN